MKAKLKVAIAISILVCMTGCINEKIAKKYTDSVALARETSIRLSSSPVCCTSFTDFPYQPLEIGKRVEIDLSPSSPAFQFPFGKSRFSAYRIPDISKPSNVFLTAIELRSGPSAKPIFRPRILILDENFQPLDNQPLLKFEKYFFGASTEGHTAIIPIQPSEARYLVVVADPDYIGKEFTGGGKSYLSPAGSAYVGISIPDQNYPYGFEGKGFITIKAIEN